MEVLSLNYMPLVRINAPEWYERADWMMWLGYTGERHPATWYRPPIDQSNDDVFFTFCEGDGSDAPVPNDSVPAIPMDIWNDICELMKANGIDECLIWVSNLGE